MFYVCSCTHKIQPAKGDVCAVAHHFPRDEVNVQRYRIVALCCPARAILEFKDIKR